jgi:hypothetical protein
MWLIEIFINIANMIHLFLLKNKRINPIVDKCIYLNEKCE